MRRSHPPIRALLALVGLAAVLAAPNAVALSFTPFGPAGQGGSLLGQTFTFGAAGEVFELDAFVAIAGSDLNGAASGTAARLSTDALPAGLSLGFESVLSAGGGDVTLRYVLENQSSVDVAGLSFLTFVDAEIAEATNTFFNEIAATSGALAAGQGFEADEPGFAGGDLYDHLLAGAIDGLNAVPAGSPDDVALALSFDLGLLQAGGSARIDVMLSERGARLGSFALTQSDPDASGTTLTYSGVAVGRGPGTAPVPEPAAALVFGVGLALVARSTRRRAGHALVAACLLACVLPGAAQARIFFDPADPALTGASIVTLNASIGLTPGLQVLEITPAGSGTKVRFATTSTRGLCLAAPCDALSSFFPQGATVTFTPAVSAAGITFRDGECRGSVAFTGAAGGESFTFAFGDRGRLAGAAQIGDITSITLNDGCFASTWPELRFVPGSGTPPPTESADLAVVKVAPGAQIVSGGAVDYDITVTNHGPDPARGVSVIDFLPPFSTFVSSLPLGSVAPPLFPDSSSGSILTMPWSDFANGDVGVSDVRIQLPQFGAGLLCDSAVTNVALATSSSLEPKSSDNVAVDSRNFNKGSRSAVPEICDNNLDDNCNGLPDCTDFACASQPACQPRLVYFDFGDSPWGFPLGPDGLPITDPQGQPFFDPTRPLSPDNMPPPQPCTRSNIHGTTREVPRYCCDAAGHHGNDSACQAPGDPNFKTSEPATNALGYAWVSAGERIAYTIRYENVGLGAAHDVRVIDVLDPDLDVTTLSIENGGVFDAATRSIQWIDALLPPTTARSVHFAVNMRADAPGNTHARNVATVIFPDAVPPSRIDTNFTEHVVVDPRAPIGANLVVTGCTPAFSTNWQVEIANTGYGYAYDVTAEIVDPPASVAVQLARVRFAQPLEDPLDVASVPALSSTLSDDPVRFTSATPGDPCRALTWRIQWREDGGRGPLKTRDVQLETDADRDAVSDARDVCPLVFDPAQTDTDRDGVGDACEATPQTPIADLRARGKQGKIDLVWTPQPLAASYDVYRRKPGQAFTLVRHGLVSSYSTYADSGLADGIYEYVVRWIDAGGNASTDSNVAAAAAGARGSAGVSCGLFGIEVVPMLGLVLLARRRSRRSIG